MTKENYYSKSIGRGCWCLVRNCFNKRKFTNAVFFSLPKEKSRCDLWLLNCGREDLLGKKLGRGYVVCAQHFREHYFMDPFHKKLKPNAVPTIFHTSPNGSLAPPGLSSMEQKLRDVEANNQIDDDSRSTDNSSFSDVEANNQIDDDSRSADNSSFSESMDAVDSTGGMEDNSDLEDEASNQIEDDVRSLDSSSFSESMDAVDVVNMEADLEDPAFLKSLICHLTGATQNVEQKNDSSLIVPDVPVPEDFPPLEVSSELNTPQPAWNDAAVMMLIETYKKYKHMFQKNAVRKKDVWLRISKEMIANGYNFSREVCDKKWHNLLITYRKIVDSHRSTGTGKRTWIHFEKMNEMLRNDSSIASLNKIARAPPTKIAKAPESQPSVPVVQISILPSTTSSVTTPSCLLVSNSQIPASTNTIQLANSNTITTPPQGFTPTFDNTTKPKKVRTSDIDSEILNVLEDERYENRIWREEIKQILKQNIEEQQKTTSAITELANVLKEWINKET